ncbi:MAG: hypothetical protein ACOZAI_03715, partial [Pseudomonadota bacterium]
LPEHDAPGGAEKGDAATGGLIRKSINLNHDHLFAQLDVHNRVGVKRSFGAIRFAIAPYTLSGRTLIEPFERQLLFSSSSASPS